MSTHRATQKPVWLRVLVLWHLLALLLPVSSVSAQPGACPGASLQSAQVGAGAVPAADQDVAIPKDQVDLAVFAANWRQKLTDAQQVETLILDLLLLSSDKFGSQAGEFPLDTFRQIYGPVLENLAEIRSQDDHHDLVIHTMLNVALNLPEMAPAVPFVWQELTGYASAAFSQAIDQHIGQSALRYNLSDRLLERGPDILARVYACAHAIPAVAEAYNQFHSETLHARIGDDALTILENNLDLSFPSELRGRIAADGTLTISLDELKVFSEAEFEKLHASIDEMQETLGEIDSQQEVILDYLKDQELKAKWQAVMKQKAAEQQRILDAAKTSISVLSSLIGHFDPKFAKELNVVGNASLQIGVAINNWLKGVSGLKGLDKVFSFSTLAMTGNVLGAVMNVVSLFGDAQLTPEAQILQEIGKLRQQVDQLRQEMHSRFDRIDLELNAIYTAMHERFNQLDLQLGKLNGNVLEVQQALVALDLRLSRIERNNFEFLNVLGRRPLLDAIHGGLGYQARTGEPLPYQPEFVEFENVLHGWGTVHAFDALNAGPTQRDYSDGQILAELNAYPLDANLSYLNGWLVSRGLPPIAEQRLPSPRDWLFASRAYIQLGLEWPQHMGRIDTQRQAALAEVGAEVEAAMQNISTRQTATGTVGNSLLFTTVISFYQAKLGQMDSSLQALENAFLEEVRAVRLQRSEPFDLYGGVDQVVTFQAEGLKQMSYGSPGETLPLPNNVAALIATLNRYNLAEYFTLSASDRNGVSLGAVLLNGRPQPGCTPDPDACPIMGGLRVWVGVGYGAVSVGALEWMAGRVTLPVINGDVEDALAYTVRNWASLLPRFEAQAVASAPSAEAVALYNEITAQLEQRLAGYQQELYARLFQELSQGALQPLAVELAGSKALLQSFVVLGLQRAVADDEFLHALLFGNQQLVDDGQIRQTYALSATQPITQVNLLVNPRLLLRQVADERTAALAELIEAYLAAITAQSQVAAADDSAITAPGYVEGADYIAHTRRALELTVRIAHLIAATPGPSPSPSPTPPPDGTPQPDGTPAPDATPTPATGQVYLPLVQR